MYVNLGNGDVRVDADYVGGVIKNLRREYLSKPSTVLTSETPEGIMSLFAPAFYGDRDLASQFLGEIDPKKDALSFVFGKFLKLEELVKKNEKSATLTADIDLSSLRFDYTQA